MGFSPSFLIGESERVGEGAWGLNQKDYLGRGMDIKILQGMGYKVK